MPDVAGRFAGVEEAIAEVRRGRPVVTVDAARPAAPGHVSIAASFASAEAINHMATHARGLIYLTLTAERCDQLRLHPMAVRQPSRRAVDTMVTVEARKGVSTGISAFDRARTIAVAIDPASGPDALVRPGHVMPLRVHPEGVLGRPEPPEAAVDLASLAGLPPAGVVCGVMTDDGEIAGIDGLVEFAAAHGLLLLDIERLVRHRRRAAVGLAAGGPR